MKDSADSRAPYFGIRDFLFYLAPGLVVLACVLIVTGTVREWTASSLGIGTALLAVFAAYVLGHVVYPLNYPVRKIIYRKRPCPRESWPAASNGSKAEREAIKRYCYEKCSEFLSSQDDLLNDEASAYHAETARYRILARFASAMVLPSMGLGLVAALYEWSIGTSPDRSVSLLAGLDNAGRGALYAGLGILVSVGFSIRARRYQNRFIEFVQIRYPCRHRLPGKANGDDGSERTDPGVDLPHDDHQDPSGPQLRPGEETA